MSSSHAATAGPSNAQVGQIWKSSARFVLTNIQQRSKLQSEKFQVAEMNAVWWMEAFPAKGAATFQTSYAPPDIKIVILCNDYNLIDSNRLKVKINIKERSMNPIKVLYFENFVRPIDRMRIEIPVESAKVCQLNQVWIHYENLIVVNGTSDSNQQHAHYDFDCSVNFEYHGTFDCIAHNVKKLLSTGQVWSPAMMLNDTTFADFTFNVRGQEFRVHKNILAAASEKMKTIFIGGMNETRNNSANVDCDPQLFNYLLRFIYTKYVSIEISKICVELCELAHHYGIKLLEKICLVYINEKTIDADNALKLYKFASTYNINKLLAKTWDFIKTRMLDIKQPLKPQSLQQINEILTKKRKLEEEKLRSIFNGYVQSTSAEPPKKKSRTSSDHSTFFAE